MIFVPIYLEYQASFQMVKFLGFGRVNGEGANGAKPQGAGVCACVCVCARTRGVRLLFAALRVILLEFIKYFIRCVMVLYSFNR